jgi:hypothetical protein
MLRRIWALPLSIQEARGFARPGAPFRFAPWRAGGHEILNAHNEVSAHLVRHGVLEPVSTVRSTPTNPEFRDGPLDVDLIARLSAFARGASFGEKYS